MKYQELIKPMMCPIWHKGHYELFDDFPFAVNGDRYVIPKFFTWNGASIPRFAWPFLQTPFNPKIIMASLVHDWMYTTHFLSRKDADLLFIEILKQKNVPTWKRRVMYRALRVGGKRAWRMDQADRERLLTLIMDLEMTGHDLEVYYLGNLKALLQRTQENGRMGQKSKI